jgi:hypothetical protein
VTVPIYTKLQSITAESRTGAQVVMNGTSTVSRKPDRVDAFLEYVKVSGTYTLNTDSAQTATREDLKADIDKGICRDGFGLGAGNINNAGTLYYELFNEVSNAGKLSGTTRGGAATTAYMNSGKLLKIDIVFQPQTAGSGPHVGSKKASYSIGVVAYPIQDVAP